MEKQIERQIDALVGALTDPIIVWPGGRAETLPGNIKSDITLHRLAQLAKGEWGLASWPEVRAYMYTVTLEFPVASEWVRIYMYAMTHYKGDMTPKDIRQDELSDHEMSMLTDFRRWIYERRVKERKRKQHAEKLKEAAERRQQKEERGAREPDQMALPLIFEAGYEPLGLRTPKTDSL